MSFRLGFSREEYWSGLPGPGIFQTQGSNPGLLHCRWILYRLSTREALFGMDVILKTSFAVRPKCKSNWVSWTLSTPESCLLKMQVGGRKRRVLCRTLSTPLGCLNSLFFIDSANRWYAHAHWPGKSVNATFMRPKSSQGSHQRSGCSPSARVRRDITNQEVTSPTRT